MIIPMKVFIVQKSEQFQFWHPQKYYTFIIPRKQFIVQESKQVQPWHSKKVLYNTFQYNLAAQSCLTLCDPMDCSKPGLPVHHQFPELAQIHVHRFSDAIQTSHPLSYSSPPAFNPSQHQGLFQGVSSSHQVTKVLEFQLQHQSF